MSHPRALAARAGIVALSLLVAWRIVYVNTVLYEDNGRPRLSAAGWTGPGRDPVAASLRENPARVEALLVMARESESQSQIDAARRAYQAAYQLAPLDREVIAARAGFLLRQGDVAEALALLDRLAETFPEMREQAFAVFSQVLASPQYSAAWNAIVARNPTWLGPFLASACTRGVEPALIVPLFLKRAAAGRAAPEAGCLMERLRVAGRWDEAYQVWLNTLPRDRLADVGFVYNGSFEYAPSGVGFDWISSRRPEREVGHAVDIAQIAGAIGKRALRVSYNGKRQAGSPIAQYLVLPAGRYVLSGFGRPSALGGGRGVQWTLRCMGTAGAQRETIAASERFVGSSEWRRFVVDVVVPDSCRGQLLQLEPVGVEEGPAFATGAVWFDDLMLRRLR